MICFVLTISQQKKNQLRELKTNELWNIIRQILFAKDARPTCFDARKEISVLLHFGIQDRWQDDQLLDAKLEAWVAFGSDSQSLSEESDSYELTKYLKKINSPIEGDQGR